MSPRIGLDLSTIIQAAVELADTRGLEEVTLASLSQKLGIKSPSLYNHVNGLAGLRHKLAVYGLTSLNDKLLRAAAGRSGDDAVLSISQAYMEFARLHPGLYEATLPAQDYGDPEWQGISNDLVQLLLQVVNAYDLEEEIAIHLVRGLRSILHGFASLERSGGFGMPIHLDDSIMTVLRTYLAGMRSQYE